MNKDGNQTTKSLKDLEKHGIVDLDVSIRDVIEAQQKKQDTATIQMVICNGNYCVVVRPQ